MFIVHVLIVIICSLFSGGSLETICFAQETSASQIERAQETLEKEKVLRERIEKGEKIFVRKIVITGVTLINEDQIKEITLPFKNHWIFKDEIRLILDSIVAVYQRNGYNGKIADISYQIRKNRIIEIEVEEIIVENKTD